MLKICNQRLGEICDLFPLPKTGLGIALINKHHLYYRDSGRLNCYYNVKKCKIARMPVVAFSSSRRMSFLSLPFIIQVLIG